MADKKSVVDSPEFQNFFKGVIKIYTDYMNETFPDSSVPYDEFTYKNNRKYIKVIRGGSVHCFVNKENGDVLKAAGWKAPAKHARGNIFDDNNGLGSMNPYGPQYLR
jgi:hypothetical protein